MKHKAVMFDLATLPVAVLTVIAHFMPTGEGEVAEKFHAAVVAILHQHAVLPIATYHTHDVRLGEEIQMRLRDFFAEDSLEQAFFEQVLHVDDPHMLTDEEEKTRTERTFWDIGVRATLIEGYLAENSLDEARAELAVLKGLSDKYGPKQDTDDITL